MKTISNKLQDRGDIEVHIFADEHLGDPLSDISRLKARIKEVEETPNAYAVLDGDLMNNATVQSVSDSYSEIYSPMQQIEKAVELFRPIRDKILCYTTGNHEARTYKTDGIDVSRFISRELGIEDKYSSESALVFIRFGKTVKQRPVCYTMYVTHGRGGGKKLGGKANALVDMACKVDSDIYIHAHTHEPLIAKQGFFRADYQHSSVSRVTRLFVNAASNLDYGGYGEVNEFNVPANAMPVIYLNGHEKIAEATM
jgi:predicted phosphodiesterase